MPTGQCARSSSNAAALFQLTALHGPAYTVSGRNKAETIFWVLVVAASTVWGLYNCVTSLVAVQNEPVILNIETYKYEAGKVPYPTITLCPKQHLDELHAGMLLFNRIKFRFVVAATVLLKQLN